MFKNIFKIFVGLLCFAGLTTIVNSYVASSSSYIMQSDSVNFAGYLSTSSSFTLGNTLGEIASGLGTSTNYDLNAGFQAMQADTYITITAPGDATMTPALNGLAGGVSNGSADWTVTTNNFGGYQMYVRANTAPALTDGAGGHSFADYVPGNSYGPDFSWNTPATQSRFGFSPEGMNIVTKYLDNGSTCNSGSGNTTNACWNGFSTTNDLIVSSASANVPTGTLTTVKFRAETGSNHVQEQGNYSANIIVSAVVN